MTQIRYAVEGSSRTFAVGDRVQRGPGGERGTILDVHCSNGYALALNVEWDGPNVDDFDGVGRPHVEYVSAVRFIVPERR